MTTSTNQIVAGGGTGSSNVTIDTIQASSATILQKTRSKLAKIRAGVTTGTNGIDGQFKLGIVGDSTVMGAGAGTAGTTNTTGARAKSAGVYLAAQFAALGVPAIHDTFMGDQQMFACNASTTGYPAYDPRVVFGGTTSIYPSGLYRSLGGIYFRLNAASDTLTFTPSNAWDTAVIYYENGSAGTANMTLGNAAAITGGSVVTTLNTGQQSFGTQTITITKAATSLIFTQSTGTPVIRGVWCYDSTIPRVNIFNLGEYGQKLTAEYLLWTSAIVPDAYDAVIINSTINDINGGTSVATYMTNLASLVASFQAAGTEVAAICTENPNSTGNAQLELDYQSAILAFCISNNIHCIDLTTRMGTWISANSLGFMYDTVHPNSIGYADIATAYGNLLIRP